MKLTVIASGSSGNSYVLHNEHTALVLECGVPVADIKRAVDFNVSKIVACLVTHEHKDHCKSVSDVLSAGIPVYASLGTHDCMGTWEHHNSFGLKHGNEVQINGFKVLPFLVRHDAKEPLGFLIHHPECGRVLFATDTFYLKYKFGTLNNIILEANYCEDILKSRRDSGAGNTYVMDRVIASHMSVQQCVATLEANDLKSVNNIVLIHLSDANSDARRFHSMVRKSTRKQVHIAAPGMTIDFNTRPF